MQRSDVMGELAWLVGEFTDCPMVQNGHFMAWVDGEGQIVVSNGGRTFSLTLEEADSLVAVLEAIKQELEP